MKTLYLVRHAEAGDDRLNKVQYIPKNEYDRPLSVTGMFQALKLNKVFKDIPIDRSYTSDYLRSSETFRQLNISCDSLLELPQIREIYCELIWCKSRK